MLLSFVHQSGITVCCQNLRVSHHSTRMQTDSKYGIRVAQKNSKFGIRIVQKKKNRVLVRTTTIAMPSVFRFCSCGEAWRFTVGLRHLAPQMFQFHLCRCSRCQQCPNSISVSDCVSSSPASRVKTRMFSREFLRLCSQRDTRPSSIAVMAFSLATSVVFTWHIDNNSVPCRAVKMRSIAVVESQNFDVSGCPLTSHASAEHELEAFQWRCRKSADCVFQRQLAHPLATNRGPTNGFAASLLFV